MTEQFLKGQRIAVLVESEFIPAELIAYERIFTELGAKVDFLANVRPNRRIHIVSDVDGVVYKNPQGGPDDSDVDLDATRQRLEVREVTGDISEHMDRVSDYAAVLIAANYTSVRLRYFPTNGRPVAPEMVRTPPAVRFAARALQNPRIVVGALCHGLWMFTPVPDLLAGRNVICHEVVLADVLNAGGLYVSPDPADMARDFGNWTPGQRLPSTVVVDGNLVTGRSAHDAVPYAYAIANRIAEVARRTTAPMPIPVVTDRTAARRILVVLSEHGYWGEELVGPVGVFDRIGYQVRFATPTGRRPRALAPSMNAEYVDPPLGRCVTTPEIAAITREWDDVSDQRGANSRRLDSPISLRDKIPARPYYASSQLVRSLERYFRVLEREVIPEMVVPYDCLLIVGGSGPIVDLVNNERVHDLILAFQRAGKPIAAECYGVACLAFARDPELRKSIIWGKRVTGHCLEYDYKDGTGFLDPATADRMPEAGFVPFNMGPPPYPLEFILRDATGPDGEYIGNFGKETSVIVDYPFITGRSTPDSILTGEKIVEVLERGLRRFGW